MPKIDRPVFILSPGRSGSTLLMDLISFHPDVAYFTQYSNYFPSFTPLNKVIAFRALNTEQKYGKTFWYPKAAESFPLWKRYFPNFWSEGKQGIVDENGKRKIIQAIEKHLKYQNKPRFVTKFTGPSLMPFLKKIFPDAIFIWIDRDPRAVVYSIYSKGWIHNRIPNAQEKTTEQILEKGVEMYMHIYDFLEKETNPYLFIKYEDFVLDPLGYMKNILDYMGLRQDEKFLETVSKYPIRSEENNKWKKKLKQSEIDVLENGLKDAVIKRGYK